MYQMFGRVTTVNETQVFYFKVYKSRSDTKSFEVDNTDLKLDKVRIFVHG